MGREIYNFYTETISEDDEKIQDLKEIYKTAKEYLAKNYGKDTYFIKLIKTKVYKDTFRYSIIGQINTYGSIGLVHFLHQDFRYYYFDADYATDNNIPSLFGDAEKLTEKLNEKSNILSFVDGLLRKYVMYIEDNCAFNDVNVNSIDNLDKKKFNSQEIKLLQDIANSNK